MQLHLSSLIWCAFTVTTSLVLGVALSKLRLGWVPIYYVLNVSALIGIAYLTAEVSESAGAPLWLTLPIYTLFCFFGVGRIAFRLFTGTWPPWPWQASRRGDE